MNLRATKAMLRPVTAAAVKAMLGDGGELALIDLREELIFSRSHLLWARSVPLSRLELNFARLVPRRGTRIALCTRMMALPSALPMCWRLPAITIYLLSTAG